MTVSSKTPGSNDLSTIDVAYQPYAKTNDKMASHKLIDVEDLSEEQLIVLQKYYARVKNENDVIKSVNMEK